MGNVELQLNRIVYEEVADKWSVSITPISFSCNKKIRLNGFASGFKFPNDSYILVTLAEGEKTLADGIYECDIKPDKETTTVTFVEPIDVRATQRVKIAMHCGLSKLDVFTKYALSKEVELEDYKFSFITEDDETDILITRLFFNQMN